MDLIVECETKIRRDMAIRKEEGPHAASPRDDHFPVLVIQENYAFQAMETHSEKMSAVHKS